MLEHVNLDKLASVIDELPTLPGTMLEVLNVAENGNSTALDLENVISRDQALSAKVLRVANSAYYGVPGAVETVSRATVLLGFQTVAGLSLTVSVYDTLWGAGSAHFLDRKGLWKHSLGVATVAKMLSKNPEGKEGAVAFTAGMLHDIGKTVFDGHLVEDYRVVIDKWRAGQMQLHQVEAEVLGVTHAEMGYKLARKWSLPDVLCESILHHHDPAQAPTEQAFLSAVLNMADYLTRTLRIGEGREKQPAPEFNYDAHCTWGGTQATLKTVAAQLASLREKIDAMQP